MHKVLKITSMQYLCNISRKKRAMNLILGGDKHQSFLQFDTIFFDRFCQACSKYPDKFAIFLRHQVDFLHAGEHQSFP